jgi:hypothetical protein
MNGSQNVTAGSERRPKAVYKHAIAADGERWVFRRSTAFIAIMFGVAFTGAVILGTWILFLCVESGISTVWLWVVFVLLDMLAYGLNFLPWPTGSITLKVGRDGRVCFGRRELCPAGTVRAVFVTTMRAKVADWQTFLELDGGTFVSVPPPYFGDFELGEHARPLGEELAKALGVDVKEST